MILVNTIGDHDKHKPILLNYIDNFKNNNNTRYQGMDSDWNISSDVKRTYTEYFYNDVVSPIMINIGKSLGFDKFDWDISNSWFQQYKKNEQHNWHNHPNTQFTNCYFLELPNSQYKTEVVDIDGTIIDYVAKEGDVVTMSAWMKHRSPSNGTERKTVIAFNSSYSIIL